jgi:hypothetical protein
MRQDLDIAMQLSAPQHSNDWFRQRHGNFTGSQVGRLMHPGRGKSDIFSADAKKYILKILGERDVPSTVLMDDDQYSKYLDLTSIYSKAMAWGSDKEPEARELYEELTGNIVTTCGALWLPELKWFADSPDGLVIDKNGCIEIKCCMPETYTTYKYFIHDAAGLKDVNDIYYWQVMSHMLVTGAEWCDWMAYMPFDSKPLHIVRIERDEKAIAQIIERIGLANEYVETIKKKAKA